MYRWLVRHGYYQKIKYLLLSPLYNGYISCVDKREVPLRKPTRILGTKNKKGTNSNTQSQPQRRRQDVDSRPAVPSDHDVTSTEFGSVTRLLSPDLVSSLVTTETLHISWICIQPNCELPSQTSPPFVEFYYVLSGSGRVSQQGMIETMTITTGDAFVVDPCSMRWISCLTTFRRGSSEDEDDDIHDHDNQSSDNDSSLILLRVTDGGSLYSKAEWNHIRLDPVHAERLIRQQSNSNSRSRRSWTTKSGWQQLVSQGMHRVQQLAAEYTTTGSSSTSTIHKDDPRDKDTANPRTH